MIQAIIFSNNSPDLLRTFLQSLKDQSDNLFSLAVIYNTETDKEQSYQEVFDKFEVKKTVVQTDFKNDLLNLLSNDESKLVSFFKDTNYFFSTVPPINLESIMSDDNIFCFSLSLGRNITHCYHNDVYNILLNEEKNSNETIKWNWVKHYLDFGRPLELGGGHIFHRKEIFKLFKKWKYDNIQSLEESFEQLEYYPKEEMSCFENSVLVDVVSYGQHSPETELGTYDFNKLDRKIIELKHEQ